MKDISSDALDNTHPELTMYKHNGIIKIEVSVEDDSSGMGTVHVCGKGQSKEEAVRDLCSQLQRSNLFRQHYADGSSLNLREAEDDVPDTCPATHGLLVLKWRRDRNLFLSATYAIPRGAFVFGPLGEIAIGDQPAVRSGSEKENPGLYELLLPEGSMKADHRGVWTPCTHVV